MTPPPQRDHSVTGPFSLKGGKLTFRTASGLLSYDARLAMAGGRSFTVSIAPPEGSREVAGEVLSVELLEHLKPLQWEIVMRVFS